MIIGISGWERSYKTGLASYLATNPEELNTEFQEYHITQGFGNLHLFKTSYPWHYLKSDDLVSCIRLSIGNHVKDTMFLIDEADGVYNPRDYVNKEQTRNLKGIGQHAKMGNIFIYTYQRGRPEDALLGVDKILRSNTRIDIEIDLFDKESNSLVYTLKNYMVESEPKQGVLTNLNDYYGNWDTLEPVV